MLLNRNRSNRHANPLIFKSTAFQEFFTNQTGLTYTLKSVWQKSQDGFPNITSSLTYLNNIIRNCSVNTVQVDFEAEDRTPTQYAWRRWGENIIAFITCTVENESGVIYFNLTSEYNLISPTAGLPGNQGWETWDLYSFLNINNQTKASLWWAQSLLSMYWSRTAWQLEVSQDNIDTVDPRKGTVYFTRSSSYAEDITNLSFFDVEYRFLSHQIDVEGIGAMSPNADLNGSAVNMFNLDHFNIYPNIWINTDSLAKSMYSAVMTDLGQTQQPNILLNATALQHYTTDFASTSTYPTWINTIAGPALVSFSALQNQIGPLGTSPAVVFTKYFCQVPKRKSTGSLLVSILVADLVFLQALWKVYKLIVGSILEHRDSTANYCAGYLKQKKDEAIGLDVLKRPSIISDGVEDVQSSTTNPAPYSRVEGPSMTEDDHSYVQSTTRRKAVPFVREEETPML